jgi:4-hydroxy-L-threonine phosphate dehydrogenase PdxA
VPRPKPLPPIVGLMLGDCTGIGPEQCARVLADKRLADAARLVVVGDARVLMQGARDAAVPKLAWRTYAEPTDIDWDSEEVPLIDLGNMDPAEAIRGTACPNAGRTAGETLERMAELARAGALDAITHAPLSLAALRAGGWRCADEHELLARLSRHDGAFTPMTLVDNLWVAHATPVMALQAALAQLSRERIDAALVAADWTLRAAGVETPRIGICALNPRVADAFAGREETELIAAAIAIARARDIRCGGPLPADEVFFRASAGELDCVLCMYHDQSLHLVPQAPRSREVSFTAGLEVVATAPAHGPGFDLVGKGIATTRSLEQAVRLAARLATARKQVAPGMFVPS